MADTKLKKVTGSKRIAALESIAYQAAACCGSCVHFRGRPAGWGVCMVRKPVEPERAFPGVHGLGVCDDGSFQVAVDRLRKRFKGLDRVVERAALAACTDPGADPE